MSGFFDGNTGTTGSGTAWSNSALNYYNECRQGGATAAECEQAANNYMLGGGGGFLQNTAGDLVGFLGGLGSTGANIYGQFTGTVPPGGAIPPPAPPAPKKNNTVLYILGAIILIVVIALIVKSRK